MKKTVSILALALAAAFAAPAFASINTAPQKTQFEQLAKKSSGKKGSKAPKAAKSTKA